MNQGSIVEKVVTYVVTQIVDDPDSVQVEIVPDGDDAIVAEVRTAKSDMGRVIGRRGRVARAIRGPTASTGRLLYVRSPMIPRTAGSPGPSSRATLIRPHRTPSPRPRRIAMIFSFDSRKSATEPAPKP